MHRRRSATMEDPRRCVAAPSVGGTSSYSTPCGRASARVHGVGEPNPCHPTLDLLSSEEHFQIESGPGTSQSDLKQLPHPVTRNDPRRCVAAPSTPRRFGLLATGLVAASVSLIAAEPDDMPRIPGAVTVCPPWLKKGAPFDVEASFSMPAENENAAPLYLDAFAEFSPAVVDCLPASQKGRAEAAEDRSKRLNALNDDLGDKPASIDRKAADALLVDLQDGFRKLEAAQRRARCVFAVGLGLDELPPHAQAARDVARAINLRVFRDVDKGELDRPIDDLAAGFRLGRDLRARGSFITQIVSVANDGTLCNSTLPTILGSPSLDAEHCDRLIAVLREHEAAGLDRFRTGAKAEYIMQRAVIHAFEDVGGTAGRRMKRELILSWLAKDVADALVGGEEEPAAPPAMTMEEVDAAFARHGASWATERAVIGDFYEALAAPEAGTYAERVRRFEALSKAHLSGRGAETFWIGRMIIPEYGFLIASMSRGDLFVRASECLVAARRWRSTHAGADPTDLALACKEAKLPGVPIDPFSNAPLRLAVVGGRTVIYSIGTDGVDDRGLKDSNLGREPAGDILFPLPAATR